MPRMLAQPLRNTSGAPDVLRSMSAAGRPHTRFREDERRAVAAVGPNVPAVVDDVEALIEMFGDVDERGDWRVEAGDLGASAERAAQPLHFLVHERQIAARVRPDDE